MELCDLDLKLELDCLSLTSFVKIEHFCGLLLDFESVLRENVAILHVCQDRKALKIYQTDAEIASFGSSSPPNKAPKSIDLELFLIRLEK